MADNKNLAPTKVIVPCRISFAAIWEPRSVAGGDEKYSVSCIIPKSDKQTLWKIHDAIEAAKESGLEKKWNGKLPPNLRLPLHDGDIDRPDDENYADCMYINASSKDAPQIVDRRVEPILDPAECGSGDYCNVSVNAFAYAAPGAKGVSFGLSNIQLVKHGVRMSGKTLASSEFTVLEEEDAPFGGDLPDYLK